VAKARISQDTLFGEEYFADIFRTLLPDYKLMSLAYLARRKLKETTAHRDISPFAVLGAFGRYIDDSQINNRNVGEIVKQIVNIYVVWPEFESLASI
jgi:hypothetical protein